MSTSSRLEDLQMRWQQDPDSRVYLQLAEEYRKLDRHPEAIDVLKRGLQKRPNDLSGQVALGRCHLEMDEFEPAAKALEAVTGRDPTHMMGNKLLLDAYLKSDNAAKAGERLELYKQLNPSDPDISELEARLHSLRGNEPPAPAFEAPAPAFEAPAPAFEALAPVFETPSAPMAFKPMATPTFEAPPEPVFELPPEPALAAPAKETPAKESIVNDPLLDTQQTEPVESPGDEPSSETDVGTTPPAPRLEPTSYSAPELAAFAPQLQPEPQPASVAEQADSGPNDIFRLDPPPAFTPAEDDLFQLGGGAQPPAAPNLDDLWGSAETAETVTPVIEEIAPAPMVEEVAPMVEEVAPVVEEAVGAVEEATPEEETLVEEAAPVEEVLVEEAAPVMEPEAIVADSPLPEPTIEPEPEAQDSSPSPATATLGELYFKQGHTDEAARIFREVLRRTPDNPVAKVALARIEANLEPIEANLEPTAADVEPIAANLEPITADVKPITADVEPIATNLELTAQSLLATSGQEIPPGLTARKIRVLESYLVHLRPAANNRADNNRADNNRANNSSATGESHVR